VSGLPFFAGGNLQQQLTGGPGRSYVPRLSLGGEIGLFKSFFPAPGRLRRGGPEGWPRPWAQASISVFFDPRLVQDHRQRDLLALPGVELAAACRSTGACQRTRPRWDPRREDNWPARSEDLDGFRDDDGCPDPDTDNEGNRPGATAAPGNRKTSTVSRMRTAAPDSTNDADGVPDGLDKCPDKMEDVDCFQDNDGVAGSRQRQRRVPDANDKCPKLRGGQGRLRTKTAARIRNDNDRIPDTSDWPARRSRGLQPGPRRRRLPDTVKRPTQAEEKAEHQIEGRQLQKPERGAHQRLRSISLSFIVNFLNQYPQLLLRDPGPHRQCGRRRLQLLLSAAPPRGSVRSYLVGNA